MTKIYTDGSCLNLKYGGWCAIILVGGDEIIVSGCEMNTTNNRMELRAVIEGIKASMKEEIEIISDSTYVVNGINSWLDNWIKKKYKGVKNKDMWKEIEKLKNKHKIKAKWIKSHDGEEFNEKCDEIAKNEAENLRKYVERR